MKIEDLKNVKLSKMTAGYLAIFLKLGELYGEASKVTELDYSGPEIDKVNEDFYEAINKAGEEIMKLAVSSMQYNLWDLNNSSEI